MGPPLVRRPLQRGVTIKASNLQKANCVCVCWRNRNLAGASEDASVTWLSKEKGQTRDWASSKDATVVLREVHDA